MARLSHQDWLDRAAKLRPATVHHIDAADHAGAGDTFTVIAPRDGTPLAEPARAGQREVDLAVAAARRAFYTGPRPRLAPAERGRAPIRFADTIEAHREELAPTITPGMGKPVTEAYGIELRAVAACFRWYGEVVDTLIDEAPQTASDALAPVTREPVGVVAAVVPWRSTPTRNRPDTTLSRRRRPAPCSRGKPHRVGRTTGRTTRRTGPGSPGPASRHPRRPQ